MRIVLCLLVAFLAFNPLLSAQEPSAPSPTPSPPTPAPARDAPVEPEKKRGVQIIVDSSKYSEELRAKLTPEQLFELEMARAKNPGAFSDAEDIALPIAITVPIAFFVLVFAVIAVPAWLRFRQKRIMHETIRLMVEKGQPIPPDLFVEKPVPRSDLRRGIVLCGLGLGLVIFFLGVAPDVWGIGCIPLFLGIGYLVAWRIERGKSPEAPA